MNKKPAEGNTAVRLLAPAVPELAAALIGPWTTRASCTQTGPEIFFPLHGDPATEARKICSRCPVRDDCLAYALNADEEFGIWAGLDPDERRSLQRTQPSRKPGIATSRQGAA
jgi:WhiB family transcriptional regulator, redox-sensing transcriptional regulator